MPAQWLQVVVNLLVLGDCPAAHPHPSLGNLASGKRQFEQFLG